MHGKNNIGTQWTVFCSIKTKIFIQCFLNYGINAKKKKKNIKHGYLKSIIVKYILYIYKRTHFQIYKDYILIMLATPRKKWFFMTKRIALRVSSPSGRIVRKSLDSEYSVKSYRRRLYIVIVGALFVFMSSSR